MKSQLANEVEALVYGYGKWHKLIGDLYNIGKNGKNLTIVVLSYNRSQATIKLINSIEEHIPEFGGSLLIMDNGSTKEEILKLKSKIKYLSFNCELIELDKNYGVAGGRNKALAYIKTDWFLSLDNDIYFVSNPLKSIQNTIAELGCRFLNLPLISENGKEVFANGGHLYANYVNGNIHIGGGSLYAQNKIEENEELKPSISTFLFGGCSVIHKETFEECGKFDDNMFIGFEDIDFSITLFKKGYKIGNCPTFSLVHDHKITLNTEDLEYEKERFSSKIIFESAKYFERKHKIKVWNDAVEEWLNAKHESMNSNDTIVKIKKPKIALIVDSENWCFANISKQIMTMLSDKYEFKYIVMNHINNIVRVFLMVKDCDLVHFFWRGQLSWSFDRETHQYLQTLGIANPSKYLHDLQKNMNISTAVYDHLYLDADFDMTTKIFKYVKNYYVSSKKLEEIYRKMKSIKKPTTVITDGIDLNKFYPINLKRFVDVCKRKIIIGWVGNSKWSAEVEDFKGVNTILKPAISELIKEGYNIEMFFADKNERMIPHNEMNNYYSKIDLYVCTSKIEGTPNPILESFACGIPVITTDVGIVQELFGNLQKSMILEERTVQCLKDKIKYLINNPDLFKKLSEENLDRIKKWTWQEKVNDFDNYFKKCLQNKKSGEKNEEK